MNSGSIEQPVIVDDFAREAIAGLTQKQKTIPAKYLYDRRGVKIFERICHLDEYYVTRTETYILEKNSDAISRLIGEEAVIIEPGAGNGAKSRLLIRILKRPKVYVPVEISRDSLRENAKKMRAEFPKLKILPIRADYTTAYRVPAEVLEFGRKRLVFFPGSTIGNFEPAYAQAFLARIKELLGPAGGLLIGVDMKKDPHKLQKAYADSAGVTAEFDLNLLRRMNRELDANFNLDFFRHVAKYNEKEGCVEMHLVSLVPQIVKVAGRALRFREGETIHSENSYKYTIEEFTNLARGAGLMRTAFWTDPESLFCVYYFEPA